MQNEVPPPLHDGRATNEQTGDEPATIARAIRQWLDAMAWQRSVTAAVAQIGLKFNEWLVLGATLELTRTKRDAVSQSDVCRALGLTRMQVSVAMCALADAGLVDRGPDADGLMWRVLVTKKGQAQLAESRTRVTEAARYPPPRRRGSPGNARLAEER